MNAFPWSLFFLLFAAGLLGTLAVIPYVLVINPVVLTTLREKLAAKNSKMPAMAVVVLTSLLNTGVLVAVASFVGLLATRAIGLKLSILEGLLAGQPVLYEFLSILPIAAVSGFLGGALIIALEKLYFFDRLPAEMKSLEKDSPIWRNALACFYGGIVEEILMRLFLMSGLAWLLAFVWSTPAGTPTLGAFWTANILVAVLFGLGHLPATARATRLTPFIVFRAIVLNGLCGVIFGWIFMTYGLEAAMVSHFCADIVIHLLSRALPTKEKSEVQVQTA